MRPEELLNTDTLPEDLHWLAAEYRLQPNDPVYLLVAWHWTRVQKSEDSLKSALMELKAGVDSRVASVVESAETVSAVQARLAEVQQALERKPAELARQLEIELRRPVTAATTQLQMLEQSSRALLHTTQAARAEAQRRQAVAVLLIGVILGGCGTALLLLP